MFHNMSLSGVSTFLASLAMACHGEQEHNIIWTMPMTPNCIETGDGDTLNLMWDGSEAHSVAEVVDLTAWDACDLTGSTRRASYVTENATNTSQLIMTAIVPVGEETHYFVCEVAGHCAGGQKLRVMPAGAQCYLDSESSSNSGVGSSIVLVGSVLVATLV